MILKVVATESKFQLRKWPGQSLMFHEDTSLPGLPGWHSGLNAFVSWLTANTLLVGLPVPMLLAASCLSAQTAPPGLAGANINLNAGASTRVTFSAFGFTTTSLPPAIAYSPYEFTFGVTGGTPPYSFSGTGAPAGMNLTSNGNLAGTTSAVGTYTISLTAIDAAGLSSSGTFAFTVTVPPPPSVLGTSFPDSTIDVPFSATLSAQGGARPYSWAFAGGTLPDGMSLRSGGTLAGTPARTGSFQFSARATDVTGVSAVGAFSVDVVPAPIAIITPSPLASGMVGVDYAAQTLTATGGIPPYTFAVISGSLPAGLALIPNGTISGTPTSAGLSTFTVAVTDSSGANSSAPAAAASTATLPGSNPGLIRGTWFCLTAALSFSIAAGTTALPGSQVVEVQSTDVTSAFSYNVALTPPGDPWLAIAPAGGSTPGAFSVFLTSAASTLAVFSDALHGESDRSYVFRPEPLRGQHADGDRVAGGRKRPASIDPTKRFAIVHGIVLSIVGGAAADHANSVAGGHRRWLGWHCVDRLRGGLVQSRRHTRSNHGRTNRGARHHGGSGTA